MADRIKGITVEIGGDTTGLNKALSGTNKQLNSTQSQLKDVERLLKLDPSNTQLLEQKQRLLGEAVGGTREKLAALKDAEAQVQQQFAEGKVSQEQYEALQREIIDTENRLRDLEDQADRSNAALSKVTAVADQVSTGAAKVSKATAPITAGVVGLGVAAVTAMNNVDEGLDVVMTKTGATGEAAQELKAVYDKVATTIPGSFGDIGAAVGEVNTRLGFTGEKLEQASEQFLKFAKVNEADVNTSVQLVTRAMGDAGIAADDYSMVLDALTVAGQTSGISVDTLANNLAKYGAPMRALGIDTQQSIAMFAGWEKAGVNTEIAFSGMKKAISTWGAAGKDATVEFQATLDKIKAAPDIASATSLAIEAFGAKAGPDLADAIRGGRFEVEEYITALQNAGGAVNDTYGMVVDEVDDAQLAIQTMQVAMHDVGEIIAKTLAPILLDVAQAVQQVFEWFGNLDRGTQNFIITAIAAVAAISPIAGVISGISGAISILTTSVIPALSDALLFLAANPIAIVIVVIAAVVAAIVALWQTNEDFRNAVMEIWANIQAVFQGFMEWLGNVFATDWTEQFGAIGHVMNALFGSLSDIWGDIKQIFSGIITFIKGVFSGDWEAAWQGISDVFAGIINGIADIAKSPINAVIGIINAMLQGVTDAVNWVVEQLNKISVTIPDWVPGIGGETFGVQIDPITAPQITPLAQGGVIPPNSPFLALMGDQKSGTNIEAPLDTLVQAFNAAAAGLVSQGGGGLAHLDIDLHVQAKDGISRELAFQVGRVTQLQGEKLTIGV